MHPLRFLRGMACLNNSYKKTRSCSRLPADGYAHHAYTTRLGPRFVPADKNDVTIGVISRLVTALDRAGRGGGLPKRLKIYLTEFGIQSEPDKISGVSFERQPAYFAIAEHIAYVNSRVALFSQYLMRDDAPREEGYRFRGFESGLRRNDGRAKPAYRAFANPLAVERYGATDVLWGLIRPQSGVTRVTIEARRSGRSFTRLRTLNTTSNGVFGLRARHRNKQQYRVRWTGQDGPDPRRPADPRVLNKWGRDPVAPGRRRPDKCGMRRVSRRNLLGLRVQDCDGEEIGRVVDTWPDDGGWEMVLVIVRLQRFGERRDAAGRRRWSGGAGCCGCRTRATRSRTLPRRASASHRAEDPWLAIAYWRAEEPARAIAIVPTQWRRSSGYFVMERPSPTIPSPTPIVS